ncbi:MAG TPA: dihydrofolate reductase [Methyloceanibacter sp.]|nr:dihydrofolate reductase [Methyloceanibacter sp.]
MSGKATAAARAPIIALVVARAENGAIGVGGDLPWRLSTDLKQFRKVTLGKPVIMGRRTFMSLPRALDGRANIVLTRNAAFVAPGAVMAYNLEEALDVARKEAANAGVDEIMVIGGDDVFRAVMPLAKRIYLTEVHASPHADTWFKDFNLKDWRELSRERHEPGPKDQHPFSFVVLERP